MHPAPSLRAADGLGWAAFFLGIAIAFTTAVLLLTTLVAGPIEGISWTTSADVFTFSGYYAAQFIIIPLAFHRRKWWAWDAVMANLILLWPGVPLLIAVLVAPEKPDNPAPMSLGVRIFLGLLFAVVFLVPLIGATRLLIRPEVRASFAVDLPGGIRIVAAYALSYVPFKFFDAIASEPQVLFGVPIPGLRGWLWFTVVAGLFSIAGIGLYRRQRTGWFAASAAAVLVSGQGLIGLVNPALSSFPAQSSELAAVLNGMYLATGIAAGIPLLRHGDLQP